MSRKKKSYDIVNLMGGKRTKDVPEHNREQHPQQIPKCLPQQSR